MAFITHQAERMVLPDRGISTPRWTRLDLAAHSAMKLGPMAKAVWPAAVNKLSSQRAWKDSPYPYGRAKLYLLAPRSLRAPMAVNF